MSPFGLTTGKREIEETWGIGLIYRFDVAALLEALKCDPDGGNTDSEETGLLGVHHDHVLDVAISRKHAAAFVDRNRGGRITGLPHHKLAIAASLLDANLAITDSREGGLLSSRLGVLGVL